MPVYASTGPVLAHNGMFTALCLLCCIYLTTYELSNVMYNVVPVVAVPLFIDQPYHAAKPKHRCLTRNRKQKLS